MDIDNLSIPSSCSAGDVEQVVFTGSSKACSAVPQHVTTTRRAVHFNDDDDTHFVLSRVDYTIEEMSSTWYDRTDLKQMRTTARSEARLLEVGLLHESSTTSVRGLEGRTTEGLKRKRRNRADANNAVFDELDNQEEQGIFDDDALADIYFVFSEHCQATAHMMGMRDANLAKKAAEDMIIDNNGKSELVYTVPLMPNNFVINSLSSPERLVISSAA